MTKKTKSTSKPSAAAFLNWSIVTPTGKRIRCDKGLPLFQNPEYPSAREDMLVELAEANGGSIKLTMEVTVALNVQKETISGKDLLAELMATGS